jgi:hypothetical protein
MALPGDTRLGPHAVAASARDSREHSAFGVQRSAARLTGETSTRDTAGLGARIERKGESIAHRGHGGGLGLVGEIPTRDTAGPGARVKRKRGKHRTQRSRRGIGVVGETPTRETAGSGARIKRRGKASHGGHRGHGGGLEFVGETSTGDTAGPGARIKSRGKAGIFQYSNTPILRYSITPTLRYSDTPTRSPHPPERPHAKESLDYCRRDQRWFC